MAQRVDLWCAQIVLDLRKENPVLQLHCVLPYRGQESKNLYSQPKPADGRGIFPTGKENFRRNHCVYFQKI
jgi:hypothetical protein